MSLGAYELNHAPGVVTLNKKLKYLGYSIKR